MGCAFLAILAFVSPAQAQPPPPPAADASSLVAEVEVIGRPAGPAIWRATRGEAQLYILGAVSPLPHSLEWNEVRVRKALEGARLLLTQPQAEASVFDMPALGFKLLSAKSRTPLEKRVGPAVYAKVAAAARTAQLDPKRLSGWDPAAAGVILLASFQKAAGLSTAKPGTTIARLAREAHVPVRPLARMRAMPLMDAALRMDEARQRECLAAAADEVQWEAGHAVIAAHAWADGRVLEARANRADTAWQRCLIDAPSARAVLDRGVTEAMAAAEDALSKPGKTVIVVDLRFLDRRDGLLDRLRARGAEVTVPRLD